MLSLIITVLLGRGQKFVGFLLHFKVRFLKIIYVKYSSIMLRILNFQNYVLEKNFPVSEFEYAQFL